MRNVLVVDDDPSIRDLIADELRDRGYFVALARNGSEALSRLDLWTPDVIVLDLTMPVMDGWTFLEHYRVHGARRGIPIIAVSAAAELAPGRDILGLTAFLQKPFDVNELADCVGALTRARADRWRQVRVCRADGVRTEVRRRSRFPRRHEGLRQ